MVYWNMPVKELIHMDATTVDTYQMNKTKVFEHFTLKNFFFPASGEFYNVISNMTDR